MTAASQDSTPSPKLAAGKEDCRFLKGKLGGFLSFLYEALTELISLLPLPGPVLAMLLAAQGNATSRQGGVRARTMWKDSTVRGEFLFPWLCFKNEKHLSEDLGLSIREINSLSFAFSDANLDFSIWIPPIQEAVPHASVLDTPQSAPMLWATVSIESPPTLTLVKLSFPLYFRLGCRLESEVIKKTPTLSFLCKTTNLGQAGLGSLFWKC